MGAVEIREELRKYVEIGDTQFIKKLYEVAQSYIEQKRLDRMIEEGEADIKAGHTHSQDEVQKMIENWTQE